MGLGMTLDVLLLYVSKESKTANLVTVLLKRLVSSVNTKFFAFDLQIDIHK